jgi:hypothetical protein
VFDFIAARTASAFAVSTYENSRPNFSSTRLNRRYEPPYMFSPAMTWSPDFSSRKTVSVADMPDAKQCPYLPRSSAAMFASSVERVGFFVRAYS